MPIRELLAFTTFALVAIFAAHPFDFSNAVKKVELSILKEASRVDNWGDPSFHNARKYIRAQNLEHPKHAQVHRKAQGPSL
jgi:hypothetical protein